jgi:hypothetical protein
MQQISEWDFIAQEIRVRINKWDYIKLKNLCTAKETITRIRKQPTEQEKIFPAVCCLRD